MTLPVWGPLYDSAVVGWGSIVVVAFGAFAGGMVATALVCGVVEDNASPSPAVRGRVLAYHRAAGVRPRPEPAAKRAVDVALALLGVAATLPLWIVIALLVWVEEPAPVFFVKNSVGQGV